MRRRRHSGFTTIELAFVLAIVSLLAAIAVIELNTQVMLARRTEGLIGLNALWKAQQLHLVEHGRYAASFAELDFAIEGGSLVPLTPNMYRGPLYTYQLTQPWGVGSYYCIATAQLDGDPWPDVLEVMETGGGTP